MRRIVTNPEDPAALQRFRSAPLPERLDRGRDGQAAKRQVSSYRGDTEVNRDPRPKAEQPRQWAPGCVRVRTAVAAARGTHELIGAHAAELAWTLVRHALDQLPKTVQLFRDGDTRFENAQTGLIIAIMGPALFTPEKECYTVLIL
jgi:hypothetical protein